MPPSIYVTRGIPQEGIDILLRGGFRVDVNPHDRGLTKTELVERIKGRDGVLCQFTDAVDKDVLVAASQAVVFSNYAVGYNNIDVACATRLGILVTHTPGVLTDATADLTWALLFAAARRIAECDRFTRAGKFKTWGPMFFLGMDITGKTLGVVGAGRIGMAVALRSAGFRMRVLYCDDNANPVLEEEIGAARVGLKKLLQESDFVSLHVPLLPETRHLIGETEFGLMKKTAILINTSRGPVVDEKALVLTLKNGTIAGAGLDVYENEPELEPGLTALDNAVIVPHIGSATLETRVKMAVMAAGNLAAALRGELPPNLVNADLWNSPSRRKHV
jgi:lactate dehydrogenase-like 2-hydroxyacid dehydrogenase